MSQGFSDASLRAYEPLVVERVDTLCRKLGERSAEDEWSHTFNMADWCMYSMLLNCRNGNDLTLKCEL